MNHIERRPHNGARQALKAEPATSPPGRGLHSAFKTVHPYYHCSISPSHTSYNSRTTQPVNTATILTALQLALQINSRNLIVDKCSCRTFQPPYFPYQTVCSYILHRFFNNLDIEGSFYGKRCTSIHVLEKSQD